MTVASACWVRVYGKEVGLLAQTSVTVSTNTLTVWTVKGSDGSGFVSGGPKFHMVEMTVSPEVELVYVLLRVVGNFVKEKEKACMPAGKVVEVVSECVSL